MTARSARPARHRRIPQRVKTVTVHHVPAPGEVDAVQYLTQLASGLPW